MKIMIEVSTTRGRAEFLRRAAAGLRSVSDEGEEMIVALEALAAGAAEDTRPSDAVIAAEYRRQNGNVSATAAELGVARATVRYRLARMARAGASNDGATRAA